MARARTIHVIDGGTLHLPCGTTIAWSTHKYGGSGIPIAYTTEIVVSIDGEDLARIDAGPAQCAYGTTMAHTTIYGVEHKGPMQIAPQDDEYWKTVIDSCTGKLPDDDFIDKVLTKHQEGTFMSGPDDSCAGCDGCDKDEYPND